MTLPAITLIACFAHVCWPVGFPRCRYTRNGGMSFLRVHRLQLSWCVCRHALGEG